MAFYLSLQEINEVFHARQSALRQTLGIGTFKH